MIKILLKSSYEEKIKYIEELEKSNKALDREINNRDYLIREKSNEIKKLKEDYNGLENLKNKEIKKLQESSINLQKERDNLNKIYLELIEEKTELKHKNDQLRSSLGGLKTSNNRHVKENQELKNQLSDANKRIEIQALKIQEFSKMQKHTTSEYANNGLPKYLKKERK